MLCVGSYVIEGASICQYVCYLPKSFLLLSISNVSSSTSCFFNHLPSTLKVHANGLDIIEVAAIYASIPDHFPNDTTGKKTAWLNGIELLLKRMLTEKNKGILPKHLKRVRLLFN